MLAGLPAGETTPPPYHVLLWAWIRVAGDGEAGLRSFSQEARNYALVALCAGLALWAWAAVRAAPARRTLTAFAAAGSALVLSH